MKENDFFILAEQTFADIVQQITPEQLELTIPDWFAKGRAQGDVTLKEILNYHAYDTAWIPDTFAGKTVEEVGTTYDGDLLNDNPLAAYAKYSDVAVQAIETEYDPERIVHFTYGKYPSREAILHPASFRVFRAYDFAKLIGAERRLPAELVEASYKFFAPHVDEWRSYGIFGAAVPVADDADMQAKLFAMVGRDPDWQYS